MITCPCCNHTFTPEAPAGEVALTPRLKELLDFIRAYREESGGVSPSYSEMRDALGLESKSGINRMICGLQERGAIRFEKHKDRSIVVVGASA